MLRRTHRFHGYGSVRAVYRSGLSARSQQLGAKFTIGKPGRPYKVAVVVSRKVHKSAVTRNRIRRRIYEAVRTSAMKLPPSTEVVITVFNDQVASADAATVRTTVDALLKKVVDALAKQDQISSHAMIKAKGK